MDIKKYVLVAIGAFLVIVTLAVSISARFNLSNITADPYAFIENFFNQWSPALGAASTIILVLTIFWNIHDSRHREERGKQQVIHALHDEIHSNTDYVTQIRFQLSSRYKDVLIEDIPFQPIDTTVFDNMKNTGQLYQLEDIRMHIIFCYRLIKLCNQDKAFKSYHLELLANIYEGLDTAIRQLEAKFKFLPHYVRDRESIQQAEAEDASETSTRQELNKPDVPQSNDEVRSKQFLAQAPVYFLGSFILIEAFQRGVSLAARGGIILSVAFILWALILCIAAFVGRPRKLMQVAKEVTERYGFIPLIFFTYGWIQNLVDILELGTGTWFFLIYYIAGFVLIFFFIAYPIYASWRSRCVHFKVAQSNQ